MTRTEPVAAFSVTGAVVGLLAAASARYFPDLQVPEAVIGVVAASLVHFASRWWVVPHAAHVANMAGVRETLAAALRTERGNRHQRETPPKPGVRA